MHAVLGVVILVATLGASDASSSAGLVVETVTPGYEAAKAGIHPGDVLVSWERAANPPANALPPRGLFRSPFDLFEAYVDQAPRARTLTLDVLRQGKRISIPIGQFPWRLEARPRFSSRSLRLFEEGRGLWLVRSHVARLGGEITVTRSDDLGGAAFHVRLPQVL